MSDVDEDRVYLLRENERLREDLLKLQTHSMKYNLIFDGLNETEGEHTETAMIRIARNSGQYSSRCTVFSFALSMHILEGHFIFNFKLCFNEFLYCCFCMFTFRFI
jgi:hypothetical protein